MNIGLALKKVRFEKNLNQNDVALKAKISQTYLSLIEGGAKKNPSAGVIGRLCKIYGVPTSVVYFMAMEEKDVKKDKVDIFKKLKPAVDNLIAELIK